jgi:cytochrome c556
MHHVDGARTAGAAAKGARQMRNRWAALAAWGWVALNGAALAQDSRTPVELAPMMRDHLLSNMRDHLQTLDGILADLAAERYAEASRLAEERLGMSSLRAHEAAHFAPYFPQAMQDAGTAMHHAASRFSLAAADADVDRSYAGLVRLNAALAAVTTACAGCHARYRLATPQSAPVPAR